MIGLSGITGNLNNGLNYLKIFRELQSIPEISIKDFSYSDENIAASLILRKELSEEKLNSVFWEDSYYVVFVDGYINLSSEVMNVAQYILKGYLKYRNDFIKNLNGEYNILIHDKSEREIILFNDRFASRNMFTFSAGETLFFASEIKSILTTLSQRPDISEIGLMEFFLFAHNLTDLTIYENIRTLKPATILKFKNGKMKLETYWELKFNNSGKSSSELAPEMASSLKKAAEEKYRGRNKLGLGLSGGLDSRVVAVTIPYDIRPVFARTFGEKDTLEVQVASEIAKRLNFNHLVHTPKTTVPSRFLYPSVWRTEGTIPFIGLKSITEHKNLKDKMLYNLGGQFGDVLTGKQLRPFMFINTKKNVFIEKVFYNYISNTFRSEKNLKKIFNEDFYKRTFCLSQENFKKSFNNIEAESNADLYDVWDLTHRQPRFTFSSGRVDNYIFQKIKLFTDYNFVDIALQVPKSLRFGQVLYKKMIANEFKELSDIPNSNTGKKINSSNILNYIELYKQYRKTVKRKENITTSTGRNTINHDEQLKVIIKKFINNSAFPSDIFSAKGISNVIEEHYNTESNYSYLISVLTTFIAAFDLFIINSYRSIPDNALPFN